MVKQESVGSAAHCSLTASCCVKWVLYGLLSLVLVMGLCYWSFYHWDKSVAEFFHESAHFGLSLAKSTFLSELFEVPLMVVILILTGLLYLNLKKSNALTYRYYQDAAAVAFITVFLAGFLTLIIKLSVGRYRPELWFTQQQFGFVGFNVTNDLFHSMPSGHTSRAFSILLGLTAFSRGKLWPYVAVLFAALVGVARLALTQHYLSDVLMGAYLGILSFVLAKSILCAYRSCH